jgi:hypothetical protein
MFRRTARLLVERTVTMKKPTKTNDSKVQQPAIRVLDAAQLAHVRGGGGMPKTGFDGGGGLG